MRTRSLALALLLGAAPAPAGKVVDDEVAAARRARGQLEKKLDDSEEQVRARVRALYKLQVFGDLPLWVDEGARGAALARRGAARRVILRDLEERRILRSELGAAESDLARLERDAEQARFLAAMPILDGSLARPTAGDVVASFGLYHDERTHARLLRRGVELGVRSPEVLAAGAGQVTFAGRLPGLGTVVVVDHGQGVVTVTAQLASTALGRGDLVSTGDVVGRAAGSRVYFEVRRGGRPVDPFPLLHPR